MNRPAWLPSPAEVAKYVSRARSEGLISDQKLASTPRRDEYLRQEAGRQAMVVSQAARARKAAALRVSRAAKRRASHE
jgi:hypothetical protein